MESRLKNVMSIQLKNYHHSNLTSLCLHRGFMSFDGKLHRGVWGNMGTFEF